jgi:hypothetical protein
MPAACASSPGRRRAAVSERTVEAEPVAQVDAEEIEGRDRGLEEPLNKAHRRQQSKGWPTLSGAESTPTRVVDYSTRVVDTHDLSGLERCPSCDRRSKTDDLEFDNIVMGLALPRVRAIERGGRSRPRAAPKQAPDSLVASRGCPPWVADR